MFETLKAMFTTMVVGGACLLLGAFMDEEDDAEEAEIWISFIKIPCALFPFKLDDVRKMGFTLYRVKLDW